MKEPKCPECRRKYGYLLFWPVFGLRYLLLENVHPARYYHPVHCWLDDQIPFLEVFMIPYAAWYLCIMGIHLWLLIRNDPAYISYSRYLIVSMSISTAVFLLYPTCQNLRPRQFPRDNALTKIVGLLYRMDTSTNVCPSEHVIGSVGFFLAARYSQRGKDIKWTVAAAVTACLTALATVFLKQHSVIDLIAALPVCVVGWLAAFHPISVKKNGLHPRTRFGRSSA